MRLCRIELDGTPQAAFYGEDQVVPLLSASAAYANNVGQSLEIPATDELLTFLPPDGSHREQANKLHDWVAQLDESVRGELALPTAQARLLVPHPRPNKLLLLAGNYAAHIEEGGGIAAERAETFPYVFMKPPSTTLTHPGDPVRIPSISPDAIDWELELAIVIGRGGKAIKEAEALQHVAGYTVVNDISNRKFRPNPQRKERKNNAFFDWLHGKWHDTFCPCGPCTASAEAIPDPQSLEMKLHVNGQLHQDATTAQQIFPVAAVIEFISNIVTLEPGDIISTGTPAGVGNTTGTYLKPGDRIDAYIGSIGTLSNPVAAEG
jgi:2,4-didehydro-3-deoxy-L-rhamnonate hydrolase